MTTTATIRIVPLQEEHIQETAQLVTQTACEFDPVGKLLQIEYHSYLPIILQDVQRCQKLGKSLIALDGAVIAGFLLLDVYPNANVNYDTYFQANKQLAIWYVLIFAVRDCAFFNKVIAKSSSNKYLYGVYGGVAKEYANKNISTQLNAHAMQQFANEFVGFFGECTHVASKKVAANLGGICMHQVPYDTFWCKRTQSFVLQPLAQQHSSCALMFIPFHNNNEQEKPNLVMSKL